MQVTVGRNLFQVLDGTLVYSTVGTGVAIAIIIPSILVPVALILVGAIASVLIIMLVFRKRYKTKEGHFTTEMRELQTSITQKGENKLSKISN